MMLGIMGVGENFRQWIPLHDKLVERLGREGKEVIFMSDSDNSVRIRITGEDFYPVLYETCLESVDADVDLMVESMMLEFTFR
jgi:hypothetical protein